MLITTGLCLLTLLLKPAKWLKSTPAHTLSWWTRWFLYNDVTNSHVVGVSYDVIIGFHLLQEGQEIKC